MSAIPDTFRFLDPGPLCDRELELVAPDARHVDDVLAAWQHPETVAAHDPRRPPPTRKALLEFLRAAPQGRQAGDAERGLVRQYTFWMRLHDGRGDAQSLPPLRIAGSISLRVGSTLDLELYYGHIGYHVLPPARGRRYAERACRLLLPLCRRHGMRTVWITCNPDNLGSRRTCERLGMEFAGIIPVPPTDPLFERGDREKCRYRLEL